MKRILFVLLVCSAAVVNAADSPRKSFPDDFTPTKCETVDCRSYDQDQMQSAAATILGLSLDRKWLQQHLAELQPDFQLLCTKITSCFATPPNNNLFCLDILSEEFAAICDRHFDKVKSPDDHQQCFETVETYLLGLDQRMHPRFLATQACAQKTDPVRPNKALDVWMVPSDIKLPATLVPMTIFAIDRDTHVPVMANMTIEGQTVYAPANPAGWLATGYPFKWPVKYARVPNAQGHEDSIGPTVSLNAEGYPPVSFRMPVEVPRMVASIEPNAASLRPGKTYRVTVKAKDSTSGETVYGRVMAGDMIVGSTNQPFELDLRKKKQRPEIWIADASNSASDFVVAPAK